VGCEPRRSRAVPVRDWMRNPDIDAGSRSDELTTAEGEELAALRRENRRRREDVEILMGPSS